MRNLKYILLIIPVLLLTVSCHNKKTGGPVITTPVDLKEIVKSDTLRVATMYGSTSYFMFRDEMMGFDYDMAQNLANYMHLNLKISIAQSEKDMYRMLEERRVDVICYNVIQTKELKKQFSFVFPQPFSYQVLVQNLSANSISEVTDLVGKTINVRENSIYHQRLKSLSDEIGGTFNIKFMPDSLTDDDLIDMVAENKIEYTVAFHNTALLHKSYYRNIDCRMPVGFEQKNGWVVRNESKLLKSAIDKWQDIPEVANLEADLFKKYWEKSPYIALRRIMVPKGAISPFDHLFRKYAAEINWDWRLLASIAFHESRFDYKQVSWAGAAGLMQLMPRTAANFGLSRRTVFDPESNIEASVQYIKSLDMAFRQIRDKKERVKFILAAYNSGPSHVIDAMALARKYGKNPHRWFDHVEFFLIRKNEPKYYNDPVVKYGSFSSHETIKYVKGTLGTYDKYCRKK